jgi:hypothetical protein
MITKKPLNINDEDVFDGMTRVERPLSQPTSMSYSLQRLRLAEISRNIIDRTPLMMANFSGLNRDDVMDIDTDLQMLMNDVPLFFSMSKAKIIETFKLSPAQADDILYQRYMLYFFLYGQRCKLHLPYFIRGFVDTAYSSSRDICVKSARLIIQSESYLGDLGLRTGTRFRFTGLVLGIFMASIVLLMDLCMNKSSSRHEEQQVEVMKAFRILDEAKNESETVARFVDSLMHILRKHKVSPPKPALNKQFQPGGGSEQLETASAREVTDDTLATQSHTEDTGVPLGGPSSSMLGVNGDSDFNMVADGPLNGQDLSSYFDELAQDFEQGVEVGNFDWDSIFSELDSSFI